MEGHGKPQHDQQHEGQVCGAQRTGKGRGRARWPLARRPAAAQQRQRPHPGITAPALHCRPSSQMEMAEMASLTASRKAAQGGGGGGGGGRRWEERAGFEGWAPCGRGRTARVSLHSCSPKRVAAKTREKNCRLQAGGQGIGGEKWRGVRSRAAQQQSNLLSLQPPPTPTGTAGGCTAAHRQWTGSPSARCGSGAARRWPSAGEAWRSGQALRAAPWPQPPPAPTARRLPPGTCSV